MFEIIWGNKSNESGGLNLSLIRQLANLQKLLHILAQLSSITLSVSAERDPGLE